MSTEFYNYKNIWAPKFGSLENKLRNVDGKVGELTHHNTTNQERLKELQPLIELNYPDTSKDLRTCLIDYVFEAWNKEYNDTFARKSEYLRYAEGQEVKNKQYFQEIRDLQHALFRVKENMLESAEIHELLQKKASTIELGHVSDQLMNMPTNSAMDIRFKQVQQEL